MPDPARPDWLLDEVAHAGRENLDRDHARRYDSKMDASARAETALLAALGLGPGSTLVELGAGTGQLTVEAARLGAHVTAVDVSPVMLAVLRDKTSEHALSNVEIVEAGFLSYVREPRSVDFVYSRFALHHLPDFWKVHALQRIHDMLVPGGVLRISDVVYDFEPGDAAARLEAWCSSGRDVAPSTPIEDGWGRWELAEHIRDEHSTYGWLLEAMFDRVGFEIEQCEKPDDTTANYLLRRRRQ